MDNLIVLKDQYQKEIYKLKDQINLNKDCTLLKDRLNAYVSGYLALSKLDRLNHTDNMKNNFLSVVLYNKERSKIINSQLV